MSQSRRRAWLATLTAAGLTGLAALGAPPPARADPLPTPSFTGSSQAQPLALPVLAPVGGPRTVGSDVSVEIATMEPLEVRQGADRVTVRGQLRRPAGEGSATELSDLHLQLWLGPVVPTRSALDAGDLTAQPLLRQVAAQEQVAAARTLPPGGAAAFTVRTDAGALVRAGLSPDRVTSLVVRVVQGGGGGLGAGGVEVARAQTWLPSLSAAPEGAVRVSLVLPVTAEPAATLPAAAAAAAAAARARARAGVADPGLDAALSRTRLLLAAAQAGPGPGERQAATALVVDPALVQRACAAGSGCPGEPATGRTPEPAADAWLVSLRAAAAAAGVSVSALPYADTDLDALTGAGAQAQAVSVLTGSATRLARQLGRAGTVAPDPGVPPAGSATRATLDALAAAGVRTVVLDSTTLPAHATLTPGAAAVLDATGGPVGGVVADPGLQAQLVAADDPTATGQPGAAPPTRLAVQRLVATLAAITLEEPNAVPTRGVVLLAPRTWSASPGYAALLVQELALDRWVVPVTPRGAATGALPDPSRGRRLPRVDPSALPAADVRAVAAVRARIATLRDLLGNAARPAAAAALAPPMVLDDALASTLGAAARSDPATAVGLRSAVRAAVEGQLRLVTLGYSRSVLITGNGGRLSVQVTNSLPMPVRLQVRVESAGSRLGAASQRFDVPAGVVGRPARQQVTIPVTSRTSGRFPVVLRLLTPDGSPIAAPGQILVRSQDYGAAAIGITAGALFVLAVALATRGIRALRRRRAPRPLGGTP